MAVVHCEEVVGRDGSRDVNENKRYTRVFQLLTDDPTDGAKVVRDHPDLPGYGDIWQQVDASGTITDSDPDALCVERRVSQTDGENFQNWQVVCEYVGRGDPTLEAPEVDFVEETWQETAQRDQFGQLVANAAGDPFEAGLTRENKRLVLVITRNVLTYSPSLVDRLRNTVNLAPILDERFPAEFPAESCRLDSFTAKAVWYPDNSNIHYYRVTLRISVNRGGWQAEYLNAGFNHLVTRTRDVLGVPVPYTEKCGIILGGGTRPPTPQPLNADGTWPLSGEPNYLTFVRYPPTDWFELEDFLNF